MDLQHLEAISTFSLVVTSPLARTQPAAKVSLVATSSLLQQKVIGRVVTNNCPGPLESG